MVVTVVVLEAMVTMGVRSGGGARDSSWGSGGGDRSDGGGVVFMCLV